jgi:hypothetical protein
MPRAAGRADGERTRHAVSSRGVRRHARFLVTATIAKVASKAARHVFRPDFLRRVHADAHRTFTDALGLTSALGPHTTVGEMYEHLYREMRRSYRTEYLYKNEIIRTVFEARHNPDRSTVLLERHIAGWASRVDMVVVNGTTTAYEIKTDLDDVTRLRKQTNFSLQAFDRVIVVCSERSVEAVRRETDERVGIYVLTSEGRVHRVRGYVQNAEMVDPAAVFSILQRAEYVRAIERFVGPVPALDPRRRYEFCAAAFARIEPKTAHAVLASALRRRFVRGADAALLRDIPFGMAHLYYKTSARERLRLFSAATLGRPLG